jgi:hypothetical protein
MYGPGLCPFDGWVCVVPLVGVGYLWDGVVEGYCVVRGGFRLFGVGVGVRSVRSVGSTEDGTVVTPEGVDVGVKGERRVYVSRG